MKAWTEDAIEQIATAELLNCTTTSTGERLALIICDNAVEYMMIAYTEMEKRLIHTKIKPAVWESTKRQFHELLKWTVAQNPALGAHESDIQSFHDTRNALYHTGKPISVKAPHVNKYLKIAKNVVELLFAEKLSHNDWEQKVAVLSQTILGQAGKSIKAAVTAEVQNGLVKVTTSANLKNHEILCAVLGAFSAEIGRSPTLEELEQCLALSRAGHLSGQNLSKRIHDCKEKRLIRRDDLCLTPKGQKLVSEKTSSVP